MRLLLSTFIILASAGCVTMDVAQCSGTNWFDRGFSDGLYGLQRMDVAYDERCAKHGVRIDTAAYASGWQDGKWEFERRAIRDSTD
jgi:hypothetical protein